MKEEEEEALILPSSSARRPACALTSVTTMHRRSKSLMSAKTILEFWAWLDIFYFKDLVLLDVCVKISMKRIGGLGGGVWGGPFSFGRKRTNRNLVLWSCEGNNYNCNTYHLFRFLSTTIADSDKSDTTFCMLCAKLIMILTRTNI